MLEQKKRTDILKILIVEDEETNFIYLREALITSKIKVEHATNGKIAIQKVMSMDFDLVLMDIKMPVLNGHDATKEIRLFNKDIPIIMQTAYNNYSDIDKSYEAGCNDVLVKPINKIKLISMLKNYMD